MENKKIKSIQKDDCFFHQHKILHDLLYIWRQNPQLRLGQLIWNALIVPNKHDMFFLTDEDFIKHIEEFYKKLNPSA